MNIQAYEEFREVRKQMLATTVLDPIELVKHIDKFSTTPDYDKRVIFIINKIRKLDREYVMTRPNDMNESYMNIKEDNRPYMILILKI